MSKPMSHSIRFRRLQITFAVLATVGIVGCLALAVLHGSGILDVPPVGLVVVVLAIGALLLGLMLQLLDILSAHYRTNDLRRDVGISTLAFPPASLGPLPPYSRSPKLRRVK